MLIVGIMLLGVFGGLWLIRPQPGKQPFSSRSLRAAPDRAAARPVSPAAQPQPQVAQAPPAADQAAPGAPAPAVSTPLPAPAAPMSAPAPVPAPVPAAPGAPAPASHDEEAAQTRYKIALNLLQRQQTAQARRVLQEIVQKYPRTRTTAQARDLLATIPEQPLATPAPQAPVAAKSKPPGPAPGAPPQAATLRERLEQERAAGVKPVITTDELAGRSGAPLDAGRRPPVTVPPSLQGSQAPGAQSAASAAQDDVRVVSLEQEQGQVVVHLEYRLASQHSRPVFVGAWVQAGAISRYFGYSASAIAPGRGTARVRLPGAPPDLSSLRIAFFEEGGQRFFVKDANVPK